MDNADIAVRGGIEQLTERLRRFEAAGLGRPGNCLMSDYLRFLVDQQLLSAEAAAHVESIYNSSRYGRSQVDQEDLENTLAELDAAVERLGEMGQSEVSRLAEILRNAHGTEMKAVPAFNRRPVGSPVLGAGSFQGFPAQNSDETAPEELQPFEPPNPQSRFWSRVLVVGFLWTIVAIGIGYFGHDKVSSAFHAGKKQFPKSEDFRRSRRSHRDFIDDRRQAILTAETDELRLELMRELAQVHVDRREYADYFLLYDSLLKQLPDSAADKNAFAWFLLRSADPWYRDPERARKLAEEAVAADPHPFYLDTLAEALYQTGDPARAVELEEQVLATKMIIRPYVREFFERQLEKFRKAANGENPETLPTPEPPVDYDE